MFGYAFIALCLLSGYLAWRGSGRIWNGIIAGTTVPIFAFIVLAGLMGRETFFSAMVVNPVWVLLGIIATLGTMMVAFRNLRDSVGKGEKRD